MGAWAEKYWAEIKQIKEGNKKISILRFQKRFLMGL